MQWSVVSDFNSNMQAEHCFLAGYNGIADTCNPGTPVCWSITVGDGKTFVLPTATGFTNYRTVAGIVTETVVSGGYTPYIQAYGVVAAPRTWGVASNFVPGTSLVLVADKTYLAYGGTDGQMVGHLYGAFTALESNLTAATATAYSVLVRTL